MDHGPWETAGLFISREGGAVRQMTVRAPAKINLSLDVVGKRADGYHLLSTIMQSLELADRVTISLTEAGAGISLSGNRKDLPMDSRNTAWKAARLFLKTAGIEAGIDIYLEKVIPAAAGLAGGSADAAGVLFILNRLYPGPISAASLDAIAVQVGADVPFCLHGGTIRCEGIGERLFPLPSFAPIPVLLCKPAFSLSTPWVFSRLDLNNLGRRPDQRRVEDCLFRKDLAELAQATSNVLESVSITAHPVLAELKREMAAAGAAVTLMSGSGPTVFGLFENPAVCLAAQSALIDRVPAGTLVLATRTCASGPKIISSDEC